MSTGMEAESQVPMCMAGAGVIPSGWTTSARLPGCGVVWRGAREARATPPVPSGLDPTVDPTRLDVMRLPWTAIPSLELGIDANGPWWTAMARVRIPPSPPGWDWTFRWIGGERTGHRRRRHRSDPGLESCCSTERSPSWPRARHWKCRKGATPSRVRIPPAPPPGNLSGPRSTRTRRPLTGRRVRRRSQAE